MQESAPSEAADRVEAARVGRFIVGAGIALCIAHAMRAVAFAAMENHLQVAMSAFGVGAAILAAWLGRRGHSVLAGNLIVASAFVPGTALVLQRGGIESPLLTLGPVIPMLATLVAGPRSGAFWLAAMLGEVIALAVLDRAGIRLSDSFSREASFATRVFGLLLLPTLFYAIAAWFERTRRQSAAAQLAAQEAQAKAERDALAQRNERLAALSHLVSSLAHEINNPLAHAILALTEIEGSLDASRGGANEQALAEARGALARVAGTVRVVRALTGGGERDPEPRSTSVPAIIRGAFELLGRDALRGVRFELVLPEVPKVRVPGAKIEQAILCVLLERLQRRQSESETAIRLEVRAEGETLSIEVADSIARSPGAPRTAEVGLALATEILRPLEASVRVDHGPSGARTVIQLPAEIVERGTVSEGAAELRAWLDEPAPAPRTAAEPLNVLLVDDEVPLTRSLARMLKPLMNVALAHSVPEAQALLSRSEPDVVVCDVMMPGQTGIDLYRWAAEQRRGLERRFLFLTGGVFTELTADNREARDAPWLAKPVSREELLAAIEKIASTQPAKT